MKKPPNPALVKLLREEAKEAGLRGVDAKQYVNQMLERIFPRYKKEIKKKPKKVPSGNRYERWIHDDAFWDDSAFAPVGHSPSLPVPSPQSVIENQLCGQVNKKIEEQNKKEKIRQQKQAAKEQQEITESKLKRVIRQQKRAAKEHRERTASKQQRLIERQKELKEADAASRRLQELVAVEQGNVYRVSEDLIPRGERSIVNCSLVANAFVDPSIPRDIWTLSSPSEMILSFDLPMVNIQDESRCDVEAQGKIRTPLVPLVSFEEAQEFARKQGIKSQREWRQQWSSPKRKPLNIPIHPYRHYYEWSGWGDFLGTGNRHTGSFVSFTEAKNIARINGINSSAEWNKWKKRPNTVPSSPKRVYKEEWKGWADFLGKELG